MSCLFSQQAHLQVFPSRSQRCLLQGNSWPALLLRWPWGRVRLQVIVWGFFVCLFFLKYTYTSVNSFRLVAGLKTSRRPITCGGAEGETWPRQARTQQQATSRAAPLTFSCFMCLSSRSSLYVLLAWMMDWKGRDSFLTATFKPVFKSSAELQEKGDINDCPRSLNCYIYKI